MAVGNLGYSYKTSRAADKKKYNKGGGGAKGKWSLRHTFDGIPTRIHLGMPEKLYPHPDSTEDDVLEFPFYVGFRYWVQGAGKRKKGAYLEAGRMFGKDDVIEALGNPSKYDLDITPVAAYGKLEPKVYYAVSGWIEEWFHLVDREKSSGDGTYKSRERCMGKGCEHCKNQDPKVFGNRFYTVLSGGIFDDLMTVQERAQTHNREGGSILITHFECPECNEVMVDVTNSCDNCESQEISLDLETNEASCDSCNTSWSTLLADNPSVVEAASTPSHCGHCGAKDVIPRPYQIVVTEDGNISDSEPSPHNIYDCQIQVTKTGEKTDSKLNVLKWTIRDPDPRLFDAQFQGDDSGDADIAGKVAEAMSKPLDLAEILEVADSDTQAKILDVANPFASRSAASGNSTKAFKRNRSEDNSEE